MYSEKTVDLVKHFEGLHDGNLTVIHLQPKRCPAGIWTAGYGRALRHPTTGRFLRSPEEYRLACELVNGGLTEEQACDWLREDMDKVAQQIVPPCDLTNYQFGAIVSLAYNIGVWNFKQSSVMRNLGKGNMGLAAEAFLKWDKATVRGKKVALKGLTLRREAEKKLFETGLYP